MITTANTPNTATDHPPPRGRRGVALIIVLGLLGLLLISAVSFAVLMRTERNAATNYRHTSSARQMLHAGLARAIEDMNADIGDDLCPAWTNRTFISGSNTNPYPENIFFSRYISGGSGNDPVPARLLTKDVMTYIPVLYHRRLTENIYAPPEWIPINYSNSVIGRYAYAVIDTSGLLDANLVFTSTSNRWLGTSPGEIRLDPAILSRKDLINETTFRDDRDNAVRYETVSELASLNSGINTSNLANFEVFSRYSTNAVAGVTNVNLFGLTTTQLAEPPVQTSIIQALTNSGFSGTLPPPLTALTRPNILYAALADYLDSDSVMSIPPGSFAGVQFNRPITEKLPMLTCFGVAMTYTNSTTDGTNYTHKITYNPIINFAGWPVTDTTATDFLPFSLTSFRGALCFINLAPAGSLAAKVSPSGSSSTNICKSASSSIYPNIPEQSLSFPSFFQSSPTNSATIPLPQFDIYVCTEVYNKNSERCTYFPANIPLPPQLSSLPASPTSTYVPAPNTWARFRVSLVGTGPSIWASGKTVTFWAECVDPRFAYSADPGARQWRSYSTTPPTFTQPLDTITGVTNLLSTKRYERATATTPPYVATTPLYVSLLTNATLAKAAGLSSNQMDGCYDIAGTGIQYDNILSSQLKMHVANAPLKTAGELGYLLCGPWETARLYDHFPFDATTNDYHRVLDSFEVRDPSVVPTGKVNLNSAPVDVLALLYLGMPLRSEKAGNYIFPDWNPAGTDAARPLTVTVTTPALPALLATNLYNGLRANGPVRGLSTLANVYSAGSTSAELLKTYLASFGSSPNVGEFEREAVIRNIAGLLTVKQQMFTIILRADAFTTRFGSDKLKDGTVLSSAIAIAQVYREATPPHKITVRLLKILE